MKRRVALIGLLILPLASLVSPLTALPVSATGTSVTAGMTALDTTTSTTGPAHPGDVIKYTATITNTGSVDATGVSFSDTVNSNTSVNTSSLDVTPIAHNDSYTVLGNVPITVSTAANGILGNDQDPDGESISLTATGTQTTSQGGSLALNSDGTFTYTPPAGFHGTDTYTYTISDGSHTDSATVSFVVSGMIWFINTAASSTGATGSYTHPFNSISAFNSINDGTYDTGTKTFHPGTGDTIFICTGGDASGPCAGSPTSYGGTLSLLNNQYLIGQGASTSITALTGLSSPSYPPGLPSTGKSRPTLTGNLTVHDGNTVDGMNLSPTSGIALTGTGSASTPPYKNFTIAETPINNTGGQAISLNQYNLTATFPSVSANGGTYGIQVSNTTGSFTVTGNQVNNSQGSDGSGGTIQSITTDGASFTNATNISLRDMTFTSANQSNNLACTDDHTATATANQNCNGALYLVNAATVSLNHLEVNGTTQAGIVGYGVNGFTLNNSEVQNIGPKTTAGTGDFDSGVFLMELQGSNNSITNTNIHDVSAADIEVRNFSTTLTSLSVSSDTLGHTGTNPPNQAGDPGSGAIKFYNDGAVMNIDVEGTSMLNIDNTPFFSNSQGSGHTGIILGKTGTKSQQKISPTNGVGAGIDITASGSAQVEVDIENYTIWGTESAGINTNTDATSNNTGASVGGTIANNAIGCSSSDVSASFDACGAVGQVNLANTAGNAGGNGINVRHNRTGTAVFDVHGNHIFGIPAVANAFGIELYTGDEEGSGGSPELDALINGNTININAKATGASGMFLQGGNSGGDNAVACFDVGRSSANTLSNPAGYGAGGHDIKFLSDHVIDIPGAANTSTSTIQAFVSNNNVGTSSTSPGHADVTVSTGGSPAGTYSNPSPCPHTTVPTPPTTVLARRAHRTTQRGLTLARRVHPLHQSHRLIARRVHPHTASVTSTSVTVNNFTLPPGKTVTIIFTVTVSNGITADSISNSAQVSGGNFATVTAGPVSTTVSIATSAAVTSSANPSVLGQAVTFTDTITNTAGTGTPSGTVQFKDGGSNLGPAVPLSGSGATATATYTPPATGSGSLAVGSHPITADYTPIAGTGFVAQTGTALTGQPQVVTGPDLTLTKSNNVSGATTLGTGWTWTLVAANTGNGDATFSAGQTIIEDDLPTSGLTYGTMTVPAPNQTAISGTGSIACSIDGTTKILSCTASGGTVVIGATTGAFSVVIPVTPTTGGSFVNPLSSGICRIDPSNVISESNESNNDCTANTVTVSAPDLTVAASNTVTGATTLGNGWTWTLHTANGGTAPATFSAGQTILSDDLPTTGLTYGTPTTANPSSISGTGSIACSIASNTLSCTASGGTVIIGAGGSVDVTLPVTPTGVGSYTTPRSGGSCTVDPSNVVAESNESNNSCNTDTVTVTAPDLTVTKSNDVSGTVRQGQGWNWTLSIANAGPAAAVFAAGKTLVTDDLDTSGGITYGTPTVSAVTNVTNSADISCSITSSTLSCTASGAAVTMSGSTGAFSVVIPVTSVATGSYTNPRSGGVCRVNPGPSPIAESSTANNDCTANTVVVTTNASITASAVTAPSSSSTITWNTGDGSVGQVYVKVDSGTESLFGQGASGSDSAPWIMGGHTYTFTLYAGTSHTTVLGTPAIVTPTIPAHFISASPNPVTTGHSTVITWSTGSTSPGQVWVSMNGRPEVLLATGPYGQSLVPWILPGHAYVFKLYSGTSHTPPATDTVTVRYGTPSIVAGTNPVTGGGTTTLDWSTGDGSTGTVCVAVNGGTQTAVPGPGGAGSDGMVTSGAIATTDVDVFTLHAGAGCTGTALASVRVTGTAAPFIAANPTPVVNSSSSTVSWNTGSASIGQVWVSEDGATEVLVIQGVTGSVSIPWLQAGHSYVFSLYAGTSHTPGSGTPLASVTVNPFNFPSISATPNPVTSGNSTTVSWDTGDSSTGEVWVSVNGGAETLVARNPKGSISPSWIQPGVIYTFTLYQGTAHSVPLAQVTVTHS